MSILAAAAVPHPPIILPEVGHGEEAQIQKTIDAFREVARRMAEEDPETLVVISPHATMYADYFHISPGIKAKGSFAQFRAPQVEIEVSYDQEFVNVLTDVCAEQGIPAGTASERNPLLDHGTMIPLYFLRETMPNVSVVRIGLSGLSVEAHYALGKAINKTSKRLGK
ncbi:MAG: AmmeMemoRadiSam system protein A, partial [Selenomonadaceae bacterium]|nr:AmmeMemoRadiSam system protein A [Selenomonadaceae bacterium]